MSSIYPPRRLCISHSLSSPRAYITNSALIVCARVYTGAGYCSRRDIIREDEEEEEEEESTSCVSLGLAPSHKGQKDMLYIYKRALILYIPA